MIIFTKFHKDRRKIVDSLQIAKFLARELFYYSPSSSSLKNMSSLCLVGIFYLPGEEEEI